MSQIYKGSQSFFFIHSRPHSTICSVSGRGINTPDSQKKIEYGWNVQWTAKKNLDLAETFWSAGVYELEKENFEKAITYFKKIDSKSESVGGNLQLISEIIDEAKSLGAISHLVKHQVPDWIKNNAKWWSEGQIGEADFLGGIQFMIKEKIIDIPDLPEQASDGAETNVPDWIKNNAAWWADGLIAEDDFVNGIKYLVEKGIIRV